MECIVTDCNNNIITGKFCSKHKARFYRYNDVNFVKHKIGENRSKNPLYSVYLSIKQRCYNPNNKFYKNYGERGIILSDRWKGIDGFTNFCNDMGEKPSPSKYYSLDRINVNGNYEPSNCKWSNHFEQSSNKTNNNEIVGVRYIKKYNFWEARLRHLKSVYTKTFKSKDEAINYRVYLENKYINKT